MPNRSGLALVLRAPLARAAALTALAAVASLALSCGRPEPGSRPASGRRYPLTGMVRSVDLPEGRAVVAHDAVPGYMDAMTMPFSVRPRQLLERLGPGDTIRATLVVEKERSWIEGVTVTAKGAPGATSAAKRTTVPPAGRGAAVPAFMLTSQSGTPVTLAALRGKAFAITFIFTRCPLPDYCPRMSEGFGALERAVAADPALSAKVRLLSVSFDPEHDTPQVLAVYGRRFHDAAAGAPFALWTLATGTPAEVKALASFFGVWYERSGAGFDHSLVTAVVGPDGRVVRSFHGNGWKANEVLAELRRAAP